MYHLYLGFKDEKIETLKRLRNLPQIIHLGDGGTRLTIPKNTFRASTTGSNIMLPPIKQTA